MITWIQSATDKHHRLIFSSLLVIVIISFIFYGFAGQGNPFGAPAKMYLNFNLNSPTIQKKYQEYTIFNSFVRMRSGSLYDYVGNLNLANGLGIPDPPVSEIRRIANEVGSYFDSAAKKGDGLNRFIEIATKTLNKSEMETRTSFEDYIKNNWRIEKAIRTLAGSGHATSAQVRRNQVREGTLWTVDVATFSAANFKPEIQVDENKVKEAFTANIESYRLPAQVAVTAVTITSTAQDTEPVSDNEIEVMAYNMVDEYKFDLSKIKEQALAKRPELEKLVRIQRAITSLAGTISDELAEKFPLGETSPDNKQFQAWLKNYNAKFEKISSYYIDNPPKVPNIPADTLRYASELTETNWRTEVYRGKNGAMFMILDKRTPDRLPTFEEVKDKSIANWKKSRINRLLSEEVDRVGKALEASIESGKSFTESTKLQNLTLSSPQPFSYLSVPSELRASNANTGLLIEAAGVGKMTPPIRIDNGDYIFIRAAKADIPEDTSFAANGQLAARRIAETNSEQTAYGLVRELIPLPISTNLE